MYARSATLLRGVTLVCLVLSGLVGSAHAADWKPIDPADLALKTPKVQADADAEALFWEVRVSDEPDANSDLGARTVFDHYIRIKIFTERGREAYATVDLPYESGVDIQEVSARTIKADGSTVELKKADIYQRTVVKGNDLRVKAVSFAVPAIAPGVIVEYRWHEIHHDSVAHFMRLPFSRELPVQATRYYVMPLDLSDIGYAMKQMSFNGDFVPPQRQRDGFTMLSLTNVPADRDEPYSLPPFERRPWVLIYYQSASAPSDTRGQFVDFSKDLFDQYGKRCKPSDKIRRLATAAGADTGATAARIESLMRATRKAVTRIDVDTVSADVRRKAKANKNADDVVEHGTGDADDIRCLFVAMAGSVKLEARLAATANRAEFLQTPTHASPYFLNGFIVAVRDGSAWTFVDPANEHSAGGSVRWNYSAQDALITDPKQMVTQHVPQASSAMSLKKRTGTFTLSADGTLEGEWRLVDGGHWTEVFREQEDQDSAAERTKALEEEVASRFPGAVVSDVHLDTGDAAQPYSMSYKMRVPGYAQRTGARLFFQPEVFQKGLDALFPSSTRRGDVYFRFPWSEEDEITIALPEGFELEQPEAPGELNGGVARYRLVMKIDGSRLIITRSLQVGTQDVIVFEPQNYPAVKTFFDRVHEADVRALVLRRTQAE